MIRHCKLAPLCGTLLAILLAATSAFMLAADPGQAALAADHQFVQALASANTAALEKLLDSDFTWTDADGKTWTREEILKTLPKPSIGDEPGAHVKRFAYGDVEAVMAAAGKVQILRVWVKRPAGWQLLVYHEVAQDEHSAAHSESGAHDCVNPCRTIPYEPKNDAERGVIASWQALETGVTNHDSAAWAPHIADEFVIVSSQNSRPFTKADRIAVLNRQKKAGVGSAPSPLVSARMFDFPSAIVMTCLHQPYSGKPVHVTRVWIERNGQWDLSISYQTVIQGPQAK
jgi:Domain of unknown function (DUF4440)